MNLSDFGIKSEPLPDVAPERAPVNPLAPILRRLVKAGHETLAENRFLRAELAAARRERFILILSAGLCLLALLLRR